MEFIFDFIAEFLLGKTLKAVERLFSRKFEKKLIPPDEASSSARHRCPFGPVLPSRDYLEAMMGDFLEQQQELQSQGGSPRRVLLITTLRLISFSIDVLAITWQNVSAFAQGHAPASPPPSSLDQGDSDELADLEIERDD